MSHNHQVRTYLETDFTKQVELVARIIQDHPDGVSAQDGAALIAPPKGKKEFPEGRFTARATDLMKRGRVYVTKTDGAARYHYERDYAKWPQLAKKWKVDNHPVAKLAHKYADLITPELRTGLLELYYAASSQGR